MRPVHASSSAAEAGSRRVSRQDASQLLRLLRYVAPYRWPLAFAVLATVLASGIGLLFPRIVGTLIDTVFTPSAANPGDTSALDHAVLLLVGVAVLQAVFNAGQAYVLSYVGEGVVADLRRALYTHLLGLPIRFFDSRKTGEITSRLTADVTTIQSTVSSSVAQLLSQALTLVGGIVFLLLTNVTLAVVMLLVVPAMVGLAGLLSGRMRRVSREVQDRVAEANADAVEAISGIRVVQSFTAETFESDRYGSRVEQAFRTALRRAGIRTVFGPMLMLLLLCGITGVLWYGGRLVLAGELTAGSLIAFLLYAFFVAGAMAQFANLFGQLLEALGASSRIFELLDERASDLPEPVAPASLAAPEGRVTFDGVSFQYPGHTTRVLRDISFEAEAGEIVALVGPSGAGKSTLVSLISRFYDPTEGRIRLDGIDLRHLTLRQLREHVGLVPQETHLFSGSVAENIRYGRPGASDADVRSAARDANADTFIQQLPDGYQTQVGERGLKLSGGQRQRVAIARALLKDPRILLLDEATSSLDSESEWLIQEALKRLMRGRTTFVIAHRLSTVRDADRVLVVDAGQIVQTGTHHFLLLEGGLYRALYERQFLPSATAAEETAMDR